MMALVRHVLCFPRDHPSRLSFALIFSTAVMYVRGGCVVCHPRVFSHRPPPELLLLLLVVVFQAASVAFLAIWMYYAAYTASLGEITTKTVDDTDGGGYDLSYKVSPAAPLYPRT